MNDLVTKIVDCMRDGKVIASYPLSWARTRGPSPPPPRKKLIDEAKSNLSVERKAAPPFEGITFEIRDLPPK
jgi:hypothetical protein